MVLAPVYCPRLIGRKSTLASMAERFHAAADGNGSLVLIAGEPGVGKSRVVRGFVETLRTQQALVGFGHCLSFAQAPYGPIVDALRMLLTAQPKALQSAPDTLLQTLSRLLPEVCEATDARTGDDDPDKRRQLEAIMDALRRLGVAKPVALVLEDLHWADLATLEFLQYAMTAIGSTKLLLVATYRSDELHRDHPLRPVLARLHASPLVWEIAIEPLTDADMRTFIASTLEGRERLPGPLIEAIRTRVEGNPLYAEELLKSAFEEAAAGKTVDALPLTIRESVLERLGRFDDKDRALLVYAAAIGERFQPDLLAEASGRSTDEIVAALKRALDLQLIIDVSGETVCYAFRHALTREAIYNELISAERRPLHARIGRWLEARPDAAARTAELAYHWWAAHDLEKAAHYNALAADEAEKVYAYNDAVRFYRRAVESSRGSRLEIARLQDRLAEALFLSGHTKLATQERENALAAFLEAADTDAAAVACVGLARCALDSLDFKGAIQYAERGVDLAGQRRADNAVYVEAMFEKALISMACGDARSLLETLDRISDVAQSSDPRLASGWYGWHGMAEGMLDDATAAKADCAKAEDIALKSGSVANVVRALNLTMNALVLCGQREEVSRAIERLIEFARQQGYLGHPFFRRLLVGACKYLEFGDMKAARRLFDDAASVNVEPGFIRTLQASLGLRLGLMTKDAELVERYQSRDILDEAFARGEPVWGSDASRLIIAFVEYYAARGEAAEARSLLSKAIATFGVQRLVGGELWLGVQVAKYGATADLERARPFLADNPSRLSRGHLLLFDAFVAARSGKRAESEALAAQSAALFGELSWRWHEAQALEAADQRSKALGIYREIGDLYDAERLERALTPVNRRGRPKTALTTRENEIAALVAAGKSNRAIGEQLYISERTVETHVSTIMDKLGVASRVELAGRIGHAQAPKR